MKIFLLICQWLFTLCSSLVFSDLNGFFNDPVNLSVVLLIKVLLVEPVVLLMFHDKQDILLEVLSLKFFPDLSVGPNSSQCKIFLILCESTILAHGIEAHDKLYLLSPELSICWLRPVLLLGNELLSELLFFNPQLFLLSFPFLLLECLLLQSLRNDFVVFKSMIKCIL